MTTFKVGDVVAPKDEEQKVNIALQTEGLLSFPCKVLSVEGEGRQKFLAFRENGKSFGLFAWRFTLASVVDKPLDHYM